MGRSTCVGDRWSACTGDRLVTKSVGVTLGSDGLHTLSTQVPCTNVCDPNDCRSQQNGPDDVDASGVSIQEGGIGLNPDGSAGPVCTGLQCAVASCGGKPETTTLSGYVYDPAGKNPLYGIQVYIPVDPTGALPAFSAGASKTACSGAGTITAVTATTTAADGSFTLTGVPSGTGLPAGSGIPIVVQSGKWRRELMLDNVTSCTNNTVGTAAGQTGCKAPTPAADCKLRMPRNRADGWNWTNKTFSKADQPKMAIVSGGADPFECLLLKIGIDPNEFGSTTKNPGRSIDFFESSDAASTFLAPSFGDRVTGDKLYNSKPSILPKYDVVLLPCEGSAIDKGKAPYQNLIDYADNGGRAFTTHFSYVWLEYPSSKSYIAAPNNWKNVATWLHQTTPQDPLPATVDDSFARGSAFADWLLNVGASATRTKLDLREGRQDLTTSGTYAQGWLTAVNSKASSNKTFEPLFTFDAPYPTSATPVTPYGRIVFSDFHVSADAIASNTGCLADSDCGYTQSCSGVTSAYPGTCEEKCYKSSDCGSSSYACSGTGACEMKTCKKKQDCPNNNTCSNGQCTCSNSSQCGGGTCSGGVCTKPKICTKDGDCGSAEQCGGGTLGTCSRSCTKSSDCAGGEMCMSTSTTKTSTTFTQPAVNATAVVGVASATGISVNQTLYVQGGGSYKVTAVTGTNVTVQNLGGTNSAPGTSITSNANVTGQCNGGTCSCTGCLSRAQCTSNVETAVCSSGAAGGAGTCTPAAPPPPTGVTFKAKSSTLGPYGWFPYACAQSAMLAQEKALEFMFFDLTSCVEGSLPAQPPPTYAGAAFTQDFPASCRADQQVVWREFDWRATIPATSSITFSAQSGPDAAGLLPATPVTLATTTTSTAPLSWDVALIDNSTGKGTTGTAPFNTATPPVKSQSLLRITIAMNPTTDKLATPVLLEWKVQYDCVAAE